jgi:hypothetical protein
MFTGAGVGGPEATSEGHRHKEEVLLQQTRISSSKFNRHSPIPSALCLILVTNGSLYLIYRQWLSDLMALNSVTV